jgi:signal transduction histidine kinase
MLSLDSDAAAESVALRGARTLQECYPEELWTSGTEFFLLLAVRGLIVNAIQAHKSNRSRGGEKPYVVMTAAYDRPADHVSAERWIDIYIRDNGPGIADEIRGRIFERGFSTKPARGLGLGLSMAQSVAESFGGSLELVTPNHGAGGAEFWLRVRAARPEVSN